MVTAGQLPGIDITRQLIYTKDSGLCLHYTIGLSFAHLRPVILSADWSTRRLQDWTCTSLPTVAEFLKLT